MALETLRARLPRVNTREVRTTLRDRSVETVLMGLAGVAFVFIVGAFDLSITLLGDLWNHGGPHLDGPGPDSGLVNYFINPFAKESVVLYVGAVLPAVVYAIRPATSRLSTALLPVQTGVAMFSIGLVTGIASAVAKSDGHPVEQKPIEAAGGPMEYHLANLPTEYILIGALFGITALIIVAVYRFWTRDIREDIDV